MVIFVLISFTVCAFHCIIINFYNIFRCLLLCYTRVGSRYLFHYYTDYCTNKVLYYNIYLHTIIQCYHSKTYLFKYYKRIFFLNGIYIYIYINNPFTSFDLCFSVLALFYIFFPIVLSCVYKWEGLVCLTCIFSRS